MTPQDLETLANKIAFYVNDGLMPRAVELLAKVERGEYFTPQATIDAIGNPPFTELKPNFCKCGERGQAKPVVFGESIIHYRCFCPKRGCHAGWMLDGKPTEAEAIAQWNASKFCKQPKKKERET